MVILVCVDAVGGYSQGPPRSSCAEMAPDPGQYRHEADPQNTTAPYSVTIDVPDEGAAAGESYQGAELFSFLFTEDPSASCYHHIVQ